MKKRITIAGVVILALIIVICLASSIYIVAENEYACTTRFSKIISTTDKAGFTSRFRFWTV